MRILVLLLCLTLSTVAMQKDSVHRFVIEGQHLTLSMYSPTPHETMTCIDYGNVSVTKCLKQYSKNIHVTYRGSLEISEEYDEAMAPHAAEQTFNSLMEKIPSIIKITP